LLRRLLEALSEELAIVIAGFGSMTCKRRRKRRGIEADECYYIQRAALVVGRDDIDLRTDPPPDLGIEIDVTHSSLDRMSIYAALHVPEVWRYDGTTLTFNILGADGAYAVAGVSLAFPHLTPDDLIPFLALRSQLDENAVVAQFRAWVRQHLAPRTAQKQTP
jgi:Uma2 family endonuclease